MALERRSGQLHEMGKYFPHRHPDSLVVHCLACPEPGVNMEMGWRSTPSEFTYIS